MTNPPPPSEPPAGWYPDPDKRADYRWWDGSGWTAELASAESLGLTAEAAEALDPQLQSEPAGDVPPPGVGPSSGPGLEVGGETDKPLAEVNGWLSETFRIAVERSGNFLPMVVVFALPFHLAASFALFFGVRDTTILLDPESEELPSVLEYGGSLSALGAFGGLTALSIVAGSFMKASVARQTWAAQLDRPEPWSASVSQTLRRWPQVLVAVVLRALLVWAPVIASSVLSFTVSPAFVLLLPVAMVLSVFFWHRLALVEQASGLVPKGTGIFGSSWRASGRQPVGLFGRLLLLFILYVNAALVVSFLGSFLSAIFGLAAEESSGFDGEVLRSSDLLGVNPWTHALNWTFGGLGFGFGSVLAGVAATLLFRDLGGKVDESDIGAEPESVSSAVGEW